MKLDYKYVLIRPRRSALRSRVDHELFTAIHKYYTVEDWKNFTATSPECLSNVCVTCTGTGKADFERFTKIIEAVPEIPFICFDVANGYSLHFSEFVRKAGDIVNVEIGGGSVCTTRSKTGVGYPQLSAVMECADAAHGLNGHIIVDGGCSCVRDVAKVFGAGTNFVMVGGIFAGHDQGGGKVIEENGKHFVHFYGLCSSTAMKKHYGGIASYTAAEGKTVQVPYKGDVEPTVLDMLGGLRSTCTYIGASGIRELPKSTTFVRVTQQLNTIFG